MTNYNKFETVYRNARQYVLGKKAGSLIADQKEFDCSCTGYKRAVYQCFKQSVQSMFGLSVDTNAWIFDQNELKNNHNGKESLKSLCKTVYFNEEALFLTNKQ